MVLGRWNYSAQRALFRLGGILVLFNGKESILGGSEAGKGGWGSFWMMGSA